MPRKLSYSGRKVHDEEKQRERYRTCLKVIFAVLVVINILVRSGGSPPASTSSEASETTAKTNLNTVKPDGITPAKLEIMTPRPSPPPPPQATQSSSAESAICHVVVENKMDDNYNTIESIVQRYPLPWEKLGCPISTGEEKPLVIFDLAVSESHRLGGDELSRFTSYFTSKLKDTIVGRTDGLVRAKYGEIVSYRNYRKPYKAGIGVTCDQHGYDFLSWMSTNKGAYCVLRGPCPQCNTDILARSCWTTAAASNNAPGACTFLPENTILLKDW